MHKLCSGIRTTGMGTRVVFMLLVDTYSGQIHSPCGWL